MSTQLTSRLGLLTVCASGAVALVVSCGDSTTTNPPTTQDMAVSEDLSTTAPDMTTLGPTIDTLSKAADFTKGGTMVTINGTNFRPGATVKFGTLTVPAADTTVAADGKSITVKVPANLSKPGKVDITVTNSDATAVTKAQSFTYYLENVTFGNPVAVAGTGMGPRAVYAVNLDGVSGLDLVVVNADGKSVSSFLNNGSGVFTMKATLPLQVTCLYPYSAAVADVNGN